MIQLMFLNRILKGSIKNSHQPTVCTKTGHNNCLTLRGNNDPTFKMNNLSCLRSCLLQHRNYTL